MKRHFLYGTAVAFLLPLLSVATFLWTMARTSADVSPSWAIPGSATGQVSLSKQPLAESGQGNVLPSRWRSDCVDCPPIFGGMSNRYLAVDSQGRPHLAYGEDHLYHAWSDGAAWHRQVADEQAQVGWAASLALDPQDHPHIAYGGPKVLRYAHHDGTTWVTSTLATLEGWGGERPIFVEETSVAVDSTGNPGVAYILNSLYYAWYDGSRWYTETVDECDLYYSGVSHAFDTAGRPHITYGDPYGTIRHAWHDGTRWYTESLPLGGGSWFPTALEIDAADHLHLAYIGPYNRPCYGYFDGTAWYTETVDIPGEVPMALALSLDPVGRPHLVYAVHFYDNTYALEHAWRGPNGWQRETVDESGGFPAVVVDQASQVTISYVLGKELCLARSDGQSWQIEKVDEIGYVGMLPALALDSADRPHIVYRSDPDNESGALKYAWYDGTAWRYEIVDTDGGLGANALAFDATGRLHAVYCRGSGGGCVRYAYREGEVWHTEVISDVSGDPSLAIDAAGRPHVAAAAAGEVWYAYKDAGEWHAQQVDTQGWGRTSLALDGQGFPHICYASIAYGLRHAWFDGQSWSIEDVDAGTPGATIDCSIALDAAGRPHISYHASSQVRYAWHDGTRWYTQTVDVSYSCLSAHTSLVLDGYGSPHISYVAVDCYGGEVRYAALYGTSWQTETVASAGWYPYGTSLALDTKGQPHIAYFEADCADLRYAERIAGPTWRFFLPLVLK